MFETKKILLTGGAGFIGANLAIHILRNTRNIRLVVLDKLTYAGSEENLTTIANDPRYRFVRGDILDRKLVSQLMQDEGIDAILHLAAESHVDRSIADSAAFVQTNIVGTHCLLDTAYTYWKQTGAMNDDQCRFLHVSTDEVYGSLGKNDPPFDEESPYRPNSPYSASKAASDHLARAYFHTYGLPVLTSNCSNNYGPFQHGEKLIPTIIRSCIEQKPIPIYGDGSNIRDWLFVEDHCRALWRVLQRGQPGRNYNVGSNSELSNLQLARQICAFMEEIRPGGDYARLIAFVTDRPGHDWRYAINSERSQRELGWSPEETLETGLRKTLRWYIDSRQ